LLNIAIVGEMPYRFLDLRHGKPFPAVAAWVGYASLISSFGVWTVVGLLIFRKLRGIFST